MVISSPFGNIEITETINVSGNALKSLRFTDRPLSDIESASPFLKEVACQIEEYFNHKRHSFSISTAPEGTDFQREVWHQIQQIGYGKTLSYGEIAQLIGKPGAQRAVARACGANPVAIIIPCHRVVAANGKIGGYAYGIQRKIKLLNFENNKIGHLAIN